MVVLDSMPAEEQANVPVSGSQHAAVSSSGQQQVDSKPPAVLQSGGAESLESLQRMPPEDVVMQVRHSKM